MLLVSRDECKFALHHRGVMKVLANRQLWDNEKQSESSEDVSKEGLLEDLPVRLNGTPLLAAAGFLFATKPVFATGLT